MSDLDVNRIENALWTLEKYRNELKETGAEVFIDGVCVNTSDALKVLDLALYILMDSHQ